MLNKDNEEDLLARWEKKYGKAKEPKKDVWNEDQPQSSTMSTKTESIPTKPSQKGYVQNVLANQPVANGEDFEENWDDDEGSPVKADIDYRKYRHPDIPENQEKIEKPKKSKKKKGKKKKTSQALPSGDFDMNWDDE